MICFLENQFASPCVISHKIAVLDDVTAYDKGDVSIFDMALLEHHHYRHIGIVSRLFSKTI